MAHLNLTDKDGNSLEFPDCMDAIQADMLYNQICNGCRNRYHFLQYAVKKAIPVGDGIHSFIAVLAFIPKLNDEDRKQAIESMDSQIHSLSFR